MDLRDFEDKLRDRFLLWMEKDQEKSEAIFSSLSEKISTEFEKRAKPFNMVTKDLVSLPR